MPRPLTPDLTFEKIKKLAKQYLKALRAGDPRAPRLPEGQAMILRNAQLAVAREFGFEGWASLKRHLESREAEPPQVVGTSRSNLVARFLDNACPDHHVRGGSDHVRAQATAMRMLAQDPDLSRADFYTAVVCGDLTFVERALSEDPGWATRPNGTATPRRSGVGGEGDLYKPEFGLKGWDALLYLTFTRLPLPAVKANAVAIARLLIDHGANPNTHFMAGDSRYTPLVGAIGEGEEGRPPHQQRNAICELLLGRGADPYDMQVGYNIHFNGQVLWWLQLIYAHCVATGRAADWADPEWTMLSEGAYGTGARWYLDIAAEHNDPVLAEWCLAHHANPNAAPGPGRRDRQRSLYDEAIFRGHVDVANVLVKHGAKVSAMTLDPVQTLVAACLREDVGAVRSELERHPEFLSRHEPLFAATRYDRVEAVNTLLDLGTSPNVESPEGERALHQAAYYDSVHAAEALIARGADIDPIGRQYQNTPLGGAMYCQSRRVIELLGRHSRSGWELSYGGFVDRLRELITERPERARASGDGETMLMYLPIDDEDKALEAARLLLANGADPSVRDPNGLTAADRAERNGMWRLAALLRNNDL